MRYNNIINREILESKQCTLNAIYKAFNELIPDLQNLEGTKITQNGELFKKSRDEVYLKFGTIKDKYDLHYIILRISYNSIYLTISKRFKYGQNIHYITKDFFFGGISENKVVIEELEEQKLISIQEAIKAYQIIRDTLEKESEIREKISDLRCQYSFIFDN